MPYVITTSIDVHSDELSVDVISRSFADYIDEAQQEAADAVSAWSERYYSGGDWTGRKALVSSLLDTAFDLPETGGVIGPLPDGTSIYVQREEGS